MAALDSPRTTRTRTSRSRSVSRSRSAAARGRPRTKCSTSRRIGAGETSASPAAAARTASRISSGGACFSRKPLAPASRPSNTYSSRSNVVSRTTRGGGGASATTRRVASIPLSCGIRTSIMTTSGRSSAALATASRPLAASPTTVEVWLGAEHCCHSGPHHRLVIDDQDADGHRGLAGTRAPRILPRGGCLPPGGRPAAGPVRCSPARPVPPPWPAGAAASRPGPSSTTSTVTPSAR